MPWARPVDLVGVSYGAYTAMLLALKHPELVRKLAIVEPPLLRWAPRLAGGDKLSDEFFTMWNAARRQDSRAHDQRRPIVSDSAAHRC